GEPDLIIARSEIGRWRKALAGMPRGIEGPAPGGAHGECECEGPALPFGVEHRFVPFRHHRSEALRAAEVLGAVHEGWASARSAGVSGRPVPIIESRVTRSASISSLQPSVPSGRIGTTR